MLVEIGIIVEGQRVPAKPIKTCWVSKYGRESVFTYLSLLFGSKNVELVEISVSSLRSSEEKECGGGLESRIELQGSFVGQEQTIQFKAFVHLGTPADNQAWSAISVQVLFAKDARPHNYDQRSFHKALRRQLDLLAPKLDEQRLSE